MLNRGFYVPQKLLGRSPSAKFMTNGVHLKFSSCQVKNIGLYVRNGRDLKSIRFGVNQGLVNIPTGLF